MKIGPHYIPEKLYRKILSVIPVACVDVVVVHHGKFLLVKRKVKPAKGQWFTIGGRVVRGEKLEDAVMRHIKREAGAKNMKIVKQLGSRETIFKDSAHGPGHAHDKHRLFGSGLVGKSDAGQS
ncbi:MAG: colanic acid biosynthesis protein WcaH [Parcubacteria group bacterium Gr01-1014_70]|nr:MAG: colanic acid biosynthesis protein WcaH [Parcubacteria group bacterium Gr01-1014_70]